MDGHESTMAAQVHPDLRVRKWDVVDRLRREHGAQSYAQLISASTSYDMLARPELARFGVVSAIAYAAEQQRADWLWTRSLPTLDEARREIRRHRMSADIVFADPWHTYSDSIEVLRTAWSMVRPGGHLVVHDCNPVVREHALPLPADCDACWCGDTWRAFVDFTASLDDDSPWYVVDNDLGIGVVRKPARRWSSMFLHVRHAKHRPVRGLPADWDFDTAWEWLDGNREQALHLVSPDVWLARDAFGV